MINVVEVTYGNIEGHSVGKAICDVLRGDADVVWIHDFAGEAACEAIANRFYGSESAVPRKDDVPGVMVGESHYFKQPADYYLKCQQSAGAVDALFGDIESPVRQLYSLVQDYRGGVLRAARLNGQEALHTRAIAWKEKTRAEFLLRPHDDVSQVFCDRNAGWEICDISTLVAINFYARCQGGQGMLRVFDLKHTPELAERIGVVGVGYPYPQDVFEQVESIDIPVRTGDVALINGALIHCVTRSQGDRLVMNSFMGDLSTNELIYWT